MSSRLVNSSFRPPPGWSSAHLQTVRSRIRPVAYDIAAWGSTRRLDVEMDDGSGDRLSVVLHQSRMVPRGHLGALVLLVHGLGGSVDSSYIQATTVGMLKAGFNVARVDLRGVGASADSCRLLYHGGRTEDLRCVLRALTRTPEAIDNPTGLARLAIVGFSLGGNMTLKLVGEAHDHIPLVGAVAVSAPLDLVVGSVHLRKAGMGVYERALVRSLKAQARRPMPDGTPRLSEAEDQALKKVRTLAEFDDLITAPRNGWRDAAEYYAVNSSARYLPAIDVPTLVVFSVDDPMIPALPYQVVDWQALALSAPLTTAITDKGGHVGFHEDNQPFPWFVGVAEEFLRELH